jgi:hypothetical protein
MRSPRRKGSNNNDDISGYQHCCCRHQYFQHIGGGYIIIHAIAFYKGFLAHDSKVVSSGSSIGDIRESVDTLGTELIKLVN